MKQQLASNNNGHPATIVIMTITSIVTIVSMVPIVGAKSLHGREMAGFGQQQQQQGHPLFSPSKDDSSENMMHHKSDEADYAEYDVPPASSVDVGPSAGDPAPVEFTFDCFTQSAAQEGIYHTLTLNQTRTVHGSVRVKLYIHCDLPQVTRLESDFLMKCGGGEVNGRFWNFNSFKYEGEQRTRSYSRHACDNEVGATCIGTEGEMEVFNRCFNGCGLNSRCDLFLEQEKYARRMGRDRRP